jgi:hypothetical protein
MIALHQDNRPSLPIEGGWNWGAKAMDFVQSTNRLVPDSLCHIESTDNALATSLLFRTKRH